MLYSGPCNDRRAAERAAPGGMGGDDVKSRIGIDWVAVILAGLCAAMVKAGIVRTVPW